MSSAVFAGGRPLWTQILPGQGRLGIRNLETLGYPMVKTASLCVSSFWQNTGVWITDGQADWYVVAYTYTAACKTSFAARCKNSLSSSAARLSSEARWSTRTYSRLNETYRPTLNDRSKLGGILWDRSSSKSKLSRFTHAHAQWAWAKPTKNVVRFVVFSINSRSVACRTYSKE